MTKTKKLLERAAFLFLARCSSKSDLVTIMGKLEVQFKDIEQGWMHTIFHVDKEEHQFMFSHLFYDGFPRLIDVLQSLIHDDGEHTILWMDQPQEHEMRFKKHHAQISLELWCYEDSERSLRREPTSEIAVSGSYDEICLPFWRALRALQALYSPEEFGNRWRHPFPTRQLESLSRTLGKSK